MDDKDIKSYDLWFASVAYEDDPSKTDDRPVLVIDEKRGIYAALKITRTPPRESFFFEVLRDPVIDVFLENHQSPGCFYRILHCSDKLKQEKWGLIFIMKQRYIHKRFFR